MFAMILGFLAKIGIGSIATKIADAYTAKQNATTDQAKIAAGERIKTLEARRDVMVAEGGSWLNPAMRAYIAFGPATYLFKIFIIDKVLGMGRTDPLSAELWQVVIYVLGFYFLVEGATTITRIAKRK
jgi:hypothetical protein